MWFSQFRRRRKMDQMARDLGATLRDRYGAQRHYRPADVYASAALLGLSGALVGYGLALYCTRHDFDHATHGQGNYDQLRAEFGTPERYDQSGTPESDGQGANGSNGGGITDANGGADNGQGADAGFGDAAGDSSSSDGSSGGSDGGGGGGGGDGGGD